MAKRVSAIILAAGRGTRIGADRNKVLLEIASRPLLSYALSAFAACEQIDEIVLVVARSEEEAASTLLSGIDKDVKVVHGGTRRQDSSYAGVREAQGEIVLIHDGARPFVTSDLISRLIETAREHGACVPVLPVVDTLRQGRVGSPLEPAPMDRSHLLRMQTPQGFSRRLILDALSETDFDVTDDAAALLARGIPVWSVLGEETNIKVTTREDLILAKMIAASRL
ncbi:2-C-methyl-D-erythritol 4-phosphate cytidylyltransferase [Candidatus Bipolaricaulota bacterium]|nr:2-C-methyl-D-erythritol 4-phosphate cytidylyltransferase [Candidatus Bipolaricaulota bacterium]